MRGARMPAAALEASAPTIARSSTSTRRPARASSHATAEPRSPPPTTTTASMRPSIHVADPSRARFARHDRRRALQGAPMLVALFAPAFAGVLINEVVYNLDDADDGLEWIELC